MANGRAERSKDRAWDGDGSHSRTIDGYRYRFRNPGGVQIRRAMTLADRKARDEAMRPFMENLEARRQATPYMVDAGDAVYSVPVEPVLRITETGVELRESQEVRS